MLMYILFNVCFLFILEKEPDVVIGSPKHSSIPKIIYINKVCVDDWVSSCRRLVVEGARGQGRSRKTWEQCVKDDMKLLGLHSEWAIFRDVWRDLIWGKRLTLA